MANFSLLTIVTGLWEGYIGKRTALKDIDRHLTEARLEEWKTLGDYLTEADKKVVSRMFLDKYRIHGEGLQAHLDTLHVDSHDDTTCAEYNEPVLPNEDGNCSLCGAELHPVGAESEENV